MKYTFYNIPTPKDLRILRWLSKTFPEYITDIQNASKTRKLKGLSKETVHAFIFTAQSSSACIKYLLNETEFYFVLSRNFSSDAVETLFSNVRMRGGFHDATVAKTVHYALQQILRSGIINVAPSSNIAHTDTVFESAHTIFSNEEFDRDVNVNIELPEYLKKKIE